MPKKSQTSRDVAYAHSHAPAGLINAGNTCFANSALQCLLSSQSFSSFLSSSAPGALDISSPLKEAQKKATPNKKRILRQRSSSTKWLHSELENLHAQYTARSGKPTDASRITRNVEQLSKCLTSGRQEDSHEFLRALLDTLCLGERE